MNTLADCISLTLIPLLITPLILYGLTHEILYAYMFLALLFTGASTEVIKKGVGEFTKEKMFYRPTGCADCGLFNTPTDPSSPALPSGHMSMTVFLMIVLLFTTEHTGAAAAAWAIVYVASMAYSRYAKRCHNAPQIIAGVMYGTICAFVFLFMASYI
jgi:membrane-associated phospholipid phosphatase